MLVAAIQSPVTRDPRSNGEAVRALMRSAHQAGARLAHFPEDAMSTYPLREEETGWDALLDELEKTAVLARELGLWTVVGASHRLTPPNRPHNSLYVISDKGEVAGRYDKRLCSFNEIRNYFTPGFDPLVFEVDGFRFGCAICIEINFPELFLEYGRLGVDCVLFSAHSKDPMFGAMAQGHAAANNYWLSVSIPAQFAEALPSGVIGPDGRWMTQCANEPRPDLVVVKLDRSAAEFDIPLNKARPWRRVARDGAIYAEKRVDDPRSRIKSIF